MEYVNKIFIIEKNSIFNQYETYFLHLNLNCFSMPSFLQHNTQCDTATAKPAVCYINKVQYLQTESNSQIFKKNLLARHIAQK